MKIGILVHSATGHTLSVAEQLREQLLSSGHTVALEQVTAMNDSESNPDSIKLTNAPKIDEFDALVFGAPVRGFRLSPVMQAYLSQLSSLSDKTVTGFVTQFFPFQSMGGKQAVRDMEEICRLKKAQIEKVMIINWASPAKRNKLVGDTIRSISALLTTK